MSAGRYWPLAAPAPAGIFTRMLGLLEARGVRSLDQVLEASEGLVEVRRRQAEF